MDIANAAPTAAMSPPLDRGSVVQTASEFAHLGLTVIATTAVGVGIWYGASFAIGTLERACGFCTRLWRARRHGRD